MQADSQSVKADGVKVDGELPLLMIRAIKAMIAELRKQVDEPHPGGLTPMHGIAVRYLDAHDDVTTVELADHLRVTKQSASEIVAALEGAGYLERQRHPNDRRAFVLDVTQAGRAAAARSRVRWERVVRDWESVAGSDDLAATGRALQRYVETHPPR